MILKNTKNLQLYYKMKTKISYRVYLKHNICITT